MLEDDVVWVKMIYPDSSENIFRGTRCVSIIEDIVGNLPDRDVFLETDDNIKIGMKDNYIFDVKTENFIDSYDTVVMLSIDKPKFTRRFDRFANSFI